jgi:hypothetical protein
MGVARVPVDAGATAVTSLRAAMRLVRLALLWLLAAVLVAGIVLVLWRRPPMG